MRDRGKYPDVALLIRLRSREFGTWLTSASRLTSALRQKQSFELWLSSIIGVTAYSQKHAPTINPRMKLISLSKSNLCPRPHPCRIPHNAVIFGGRPPRPGGTTTKHLRHDLPIA